MVLRWRGKAGVQVLPVHSGLVNKNFEKIAVKNQGKNNSQVQNVRFNQAQSYKYNIETKELSKITIKNNFANLSVKERKRKFINDLFPIVRDANQNIIEKRHILFEIEKKNKS